MINLKINAIGGLSVRRTRLEQPRTLGRLGPLEIRLARNSTDVRRAQRLRYNIFYKEMSAAPGVVNLITRRDVDEFDAVCDHLLVVDHEFGSKRSEDCVVGTYRLLPHEVAQYYGGFCTSREYSLVELVDRHPTLKFLELGRACVQSSHRQRRTLELLWCGIYAYVLRHRIDVLIGCASFNATDPDKLALPLSYLHHYAQAPDQWQIRAHPDLYVEMNRLPKIEIDAATALRDLPPLIRGYLRLGAYVGQGAVIDRQFRTTDVAIILPAASANICYLRHLGRYVNGTTASRRSASGTRC